MSEDAVAAYLRKDITVSNAAAVMALTPGKYSVDTKVPKYLYQPLYTLLGATSTNDLANRIVCDSGVPVDKSKRYINIIPYVAESVVDSKSYMLDEGGAESLTFQIYIRNSSTVSVADKDVTRNIDMRLRCLLDYSYRQKLGVFANIPLDVNAWPDPALDPDEETNQSLFRCKWIKTEGTPDSRELVSLYCCNSIKTLSLCPNIPT